MLDMILGLIFDLVNLPYRALRQFMEGRKVGLAKSEQSSLRLWKLVVIIGGGLVFILVLLLFLFEIVRDASGGSVNPL